MTRARHGTISYRLVILVTFATASLSHSTKYPQDALKCYATLKVPDKKLVCPYDRNAFCVKEQAMMNRGECGITSEYPNDEWDKKLSQCVYRKCSATCPTNQTRYFQDKNGPSKSFERKTFCCTGDLCNTASGKLLSSAMLLICVLILTGWNML